MQSPRIRRGPVRRVQEASPRRSQATPRRRQLLPRRRRPARPAGGGRRRRRRREPRPARPTWRRSLAGSLSPRSAGRSEAAGVATPPGALSGRGGRGGRAWRTAGAIDPELISGKELLLQNGQMMKEESEHFIFGWKSENEEIERLIQAMC